MMVQAVSDQTDHSLQFDAYMKITGIDGDSGDDQHQNWIGIQFFKWGVTHSSAAYHQVSGGDQFRGSRRHEPFVFRKLADLSSALLFKACTNNEKLNEVKVEISRQTGEKTKYYEIILRNAYVRSWQPSGPGGMNPLPTEEVAMVFEEIEINYTSTDLSSGRTEGHVGHVDRLQEPGA
jgi:type VI secretion system secreted protein Hcp